MRTKLFASLAILLLLLSVMFSSCDVVSDDEKLTQGEQSKYSESTDDVTNLNGETDSGIPDNTQGDNPAVPNPVLDLSYELTTSGASYAVIGIGTYTDTDVIIPDSYNGLPVTEIATAAFKNCSSLTRVTIPVGVTSIGEEAFAYCSALVTVTLPDSVTSIGGSAFYDCSSLKSIMIPNGVKNIFGGTFNGCSSLTNITIPDSVTSIGNHAFSGCSSLKSIDIPVTVTSIGTSALSGCTSLTSVTLPQGLTSISDKLFYQCASLTNVTIPNSVTSIGRQSFGECTGYKQLELPETITSIDEEAFSGSSSLSFVVLWNPSTIVSSSAFNGCPAACIHRAAVTVSVEATCSAVGLTEGRHCQTCNTVLVAQTTIPQKNHIEGIWITDREATCNTAGEKHQICSSCSTTINVETIPTGGHADADENDFCDICTQYTQPFYTEGLVFTASVNKEHYVVTGYEGTSAAVVIPRSYNELPVTEIGEKAFYDCDIISSVEIPDSVSNILDKAFSECDALVTITVSDDVQIGKDVFRGTIHIEIIVRHVLVYVPAKEATCTESGNIEYYWCKTCDMYYRNPEGTDRLYEVFIPNSHNFVDGVCTECGQVQNNVLITSIDSVAHLGTFPLGTLEGAIGLPSSINVYTADGVRHTLPVAWDLSSYNKAVVGEYTINGIIQSSEFYYATGLSNRVTTQVKINERMVGTADIVFVLDISGSMGDEIANVKNNLQAFAQAIEDRGVSARWSVITYSDYTCSSASNEQTQFIMNGASQWYSSALDCKSAIGRISLANGGDYEETAIDGLMLANTASTRTDARVFYILVTDATFKTNNQHGVSNMNEAADIFVRESINVSVVTSTSLYSTYSILTTTGGIQANIYGGFADTLLNSLVPIIYDEVIE